jgi:uncharacterized protein (TIGR00369 family)
MTVSTALDGLPLPPCAELLGWRLLDARPSDGWIRIGFEARRDFTNPAGFVQGGFLAAMLDDVMGPAVFTHTQGRVYAPTVDMTVSFLAPARPGPLVGEGQVIQLGKSVGFVEGRLMDHAGVLVARSTATVRVMDAQKALA